MKIRKARVEDIPELLRLERVCFPKNLRWGRRDFAHAIDQSFAQTCRLAFQSSVAKGYISVQYGRLNSSFSEERGQEVNITSVAVDPAFRGQGVGLALVNAVEKSLKNKFEQAVIITAEVDVRNLASQALFKKSGFQQAGVKKDYYGKGLDAFYFEKPLPDAPVPGK